MAMKFNSSTRKRSSVFASEIFTVNNLIVKERHNDFLSQDLEVYASLGQSSEHFKQNKNKKLRLATRYVNSIF